MEALSSEKLNQLVAAVDKIVEARHASDGLWNEKPSSEEIVRTMGLSVQDPQKSYSLYYHNIQKALRSFLPAKTPVTKVIRELVAVLLTGHEKENIKSGKRGADSRMATTDDMVHLIDVLSEWSSTPEDPMKLVYILFDKNKELGYIPSERSLADYV